MEVVLGQSSGFEVGLGQKVWANRYQVVLLRRQNGRLENERVFGVSSRVLVLKVVGRISPYAKKYVPDIPARGARVEGGRSKHGFLTHQEKKTGEDRCRSVALCDESRMRFCARVDTF